MDIFNNILISVDFKANAEQAKLDRIREMAQQSTKITLTLMYVAPEVIPDPETSIITCKNQQQALVKRALEHLEKIATSFRHEAQLTNKITCLVKIGKPSTVLTQQVLEGNHDLLLVSTRKKTLQESLFGSTTMNIIRSCPCPVWAIKAKPSERKKIMIGIYFDPNREDRNAALNQQLLTLTNRFKTPITTEIHLINVLEYTTPSLINENITHLEQLAKIINHAEIKTIVNVLEGDARKILPEYAQQQSISLLVLGTRAPTGLKRFFIGSTAEKVLDIINCSVLMVKPQSFISPISEK